MRLKVYKAASMHLAIMISVSLLGCGDEDGDSDANSASALSGTYALNTGPIQNQCTDGSTGTSDGLSKNVVVSVTGNEIRINGTANDDAQVKAAAAGITITASGYSGLIESNGSFNATQSGSGTDRSFGRFTASFTLTGQIRDGQWNGTQKFSVFFSDQAVTCNYAATFTGRKQ